MQTPDILCLEVFASPGTALSQALPARAWLSAALSSRPSGGLSLAFFDAWPFF
jgi:hypothetical protein